jgi:hypothetical protein
VDRLSQSAQDQRRLEDHEQDRHTQQQVGPLSDDSEIHVKICVNDDIAHVSHVPLRKLGMPGNEVGGHAIDPVRRLADDLDAGTTAS